MVVGAGKEILKAFKFDYNTFKPDIRSRDPFGRVPVHHDAEADYAEMLQNLALLVWLLENEQ